MTNSPKCIWEMAEILFGGSEEAFLWFHSENKLLFGNTPDQLMKTKFGRDSVLELLQSLEKNNVKQNAIEEW